MLLLMHMQSYRGQRFLDLFLVIAGAPFWLPVMGIVALLVRLKLGRPVFFIQERLGYNEQVFQLRKFRTMRDAHGPDGRPLSDAERLTRLGSFLRVTSLDEFPEFLNVLAGDMALVGPRPLLTSYLKRYSQRHRRRHNVRPGLTGLAQVRGRNSLDWPAKFELDLEYVDRASLSFDLYILLETVKSVIKREGISAPENVTAPEFLGYGSSTTGEHYEES